MTPRFLMRHALDDPQLLGAALSGPSWSAWRTLLIAAMGEALTEDERVLFRAMTGREREPLQRCEELWCVVGRRGGKSRAMAVLACYLAALCDHRDVLVRGERGIILCVAPDQRQAAIVLGYAEAILRNTPLLRQSVVGRTSDTIKLRHGVSIEVRAASFRTLRGPTYCACLLDEAAYLYSDESANPDTEILNAVRPGLSTTNGPLLVFSSPYARRGELWRSYRRHFGPSGDKLILVAQGPSRTFNPSLPQQVVDRALERDPAAARAEYLAEFRTDLESFVSREAVDAVVSRNVPERGRISGVRYVGFCDPSGGSRDSFTIAIAHAEGNKAILDAVRERRPPFSPAAVVAEYAELFKSYGITSIRGDRYSGEFVRELFRKQGVQYKASDLTKSDIYLSVLPAINSGLVELLDSAPLLSQLVRLERRTARGGKDSVDHPPNASDDLINAAAGALYLARKRRDYADMITPSTAFIGGGVKIFQDGRDITKGAGPHRIDHEFPDYGRRLWESGIAR